MRPQLEDLKHDIELLKNMQRRATKMISGYRQLSCEEDVKKVWAIVRESTFYEF